MNQKMSQNEIETKIIELFSLLEETFKGKDNQKIKEATMKLKSMFNPGINNSLDILFIALSYKTLQGKEISLEHYKSVSLLLKNLIGTQYSLFEDKEISRYLSQILDLIFIKSKENPNLNNPSIISLFQDMVRKLLSSDNIKDNKIYINQMFNSILNYLKNATQENFLLNAKPVILLTSSLFSSESADFLIYEELINKYYISIINIIFANVPNYLNPKDNIYNIEYITIIKLLLDGFYNNLSKAKGFISNENKKEICMKFFQEYGTYCYELIQLMPKFDDDTKNRYGNPNPIIVFNSNEKICYEMNHMKSKAIQFLSFITQISTLKEKNEGHSNYIIDCDLQNMIMNLITLIMNTFQDILSNEEKFNFIRKYSGETDYENDCYNIILYHMCVFLTRSLIREPIKSNLANNMRQILLKIIFPLIVTIEDEKIFMETDSEGYHQYINDIIFKFKNKNFRTSACFLVKKICDTYDEMSNFVLSFCLEMLNYIIKEGKIDKDFVEINAYIKYREDSLIDKFNDKIKLDFSLLIILILNNKLSENLYLTNRFSDILLENYNKIHSISFPIIKMKLCKIYGNFLSMFFQTEENISAHKLNQFMENVIIYLLNCIIQTNLNGNEEYCQALSYEASLVIIGLMNIPKEDKVKVNIATLDSYISQNLEKNFGVLVNLISNIDIYVFFLLLDQIITNIKISQRNLIFECIQNLTKKFIVLYTNPNNKNKIFLSQYFTIINSFLKGINKILPENKEEISKFNECYDQILNFIKNPTQFSYSEQIITNVGQSIKCFDGINDRSILVLKSIRIILEKDSCTSDACYNFVSTFLLYIQKNKCEQTFNEQEIFNDILGIIELSFLFKDETLRTSINHALLLILQILNANPNLNPEVYEYLIVKSFDSYEFLKKNDDIFEYIENINQLSLANVCLGFIFRPEQTLQIMQKKIIMSDKGEEKECLRFYRFNIMIKKILKITFPDYYPILVKCMMLGISNIFSCQACKEFLNQNNDLKNTLIIMFIKLAFFQRKQKCLILSNLMKKELRCNFIEDENSEEEEEEEEIEEVDDNFSSFIEQAVNVNNNIKSCDEFEFFSKVVKDIKENDKQVIDFISESTKNGIAVMEELSELRNIKIVYKNKEYTVPRKTVKIIRK